MELSDLDIIQGCLERDKKAWDLFVDRFSKLIYWSIRKVFLAHALLNREELVQEVFQGVFERLIAKEELKKLKNADGLRKFISVMACHAALDEVKKATRAEKRTVSSESAFESHAISRGAVVQAITNETTEIIEAALSDMSPKERTCVELHCFNELTFRQVGDIVGVSDEAARAIVKRAKEKIKVKLSDPTP